MSELKEELRYVNKEKIEQTAERAINDDKILNELVGISLRDDEYISQHAALIILAIAKTNKEVLTSYINNILSAIPNLTNDSQLGNFIEMLGHVEANIFSLYDFLFELIEFSEKPGFVKIYSVKTLGIIAQRDEVLKERLIEFIETKNDNLKSKYLRKEATKVLKELKGESSSGSTFI